MDANLGWRALSLVLLCGTAVANAEPVADYPTKPIHLVVPFAAAGSTDILARVLGKALAGELGQPVVIDNRPGASGNIGADIVAKANPDGYTLLYTSTNLTANPALMPVSFDVARDFAPISRVAFLPLALFKSPQVPTHSLAELITLIKANPGRFNYSSSGKGGAPHLAGELFSMKAGLNMIHVPYSGAGPALTDVAAGQIQLTFTTYTSAQSLMAGKRVDPVAVANHQRLSVMPDVPTFEESGLKDMEIGTMNGLLAPARTSPQVIAKIYAAIVKAGQSPAFRKASVDQGGEVLLESPAEFSTYIRDDLARWKTLIAKVGGLQ